jgi:hypothetical protein
MGERFSRVEQLEHRVQILFLEVFFQRHLAHEAREDGRHSPAAVLGWVKGMQPASEQVYRVFSAIGVSRRLTKAGYARFRNYLLDGERHLAEQSVLVELFQEALTLAYRSAKLARYAVEWQPDDKRLRLVGNPQLYQHPYPSPQLKLWPPGEVESFVIMRVDPPARRRQRPGRVVVAQLPLPSAPTG